MNANSNTFRRAYPEPGAFAQQAARPDAEAPRHCAVAGCGRPTERFAGRGLSETYCRYHVQFHSRHGSYWKDGYSADDLKVHRMTVTRLLRALPKEDPYIAAALGRLQSLLWWGGADERSVDVLLMKPSQKARKAFARLRGRDVPVERILARCLAVEMAYAEDPEKPHADADEYHFVQLAKATMRLAGGHRYDKFVKRNGAQSQKYSIYLRSSGLVLRHVGRELAEAIAPALTGHLTRLLDCKARWYGTRGQAERQ